jgi:hypothetical protein
VRRQRDCRDEYVAVNECAVMEMSTSTCYCAEVDFDPPPLNTVLACNLCPSQVNALKACTGN